MFRFSNQPIVSSKFVFGVGNFGVLYDVVPTTGQNGAAVLLNDGGVNGDYVRLRIDSIDPTITSLFVYEDGSFEAQGTGQWTYYYSENGIENPTLNTVTINPFVTDSNLTISDVLPALSSSVTITNVVPEYNLSISDSFSPLQSSMSLVNGIPESSLSIATTLPSLSSSVSIENVVPTYSLAITTSLPSLQSTVGLSYEDALYDITISDNLPSLQSAITLENIVPVYTLEITDSFAALQSSVNIINGELTIHVAPQNLIYIKPKPRFITLR